MGSVISQIRDKEIVPLPTEGPTFDPHWGFTQPREKRVMVATENEMISSKVPLEDRDYCTHMLLKYWSCRADKAPWFYQCAPEKHAAAHCQYEDYVLRMKEYERERRLRIRERRVMAAAN